MIFHDQDQVGFVAATAMEDAINANSTDIVSKLNANQSVEFLGVKFTPKQFNSLMTVWHASIATAIENYDDMKESEQHTNIAKTEAIIKTMHTANLSDLLN